MTGADWVSWWCCTWRWMDPGWLSHVRAERGVDFTAFAGVSRSQHRELLSCLGVTPSQPPTPQADAVQWLSLTPAQRLQALSLVQAICFAVRGDHLTVSDAHWSWCRGVAKALRPGLWLSAEVVDARAMLGAWLSEDCWSRLRLCWAPDEGLVPARDLPSRKLDALWRAVLWRVGTA